MKSRRRGLKSYFTENGTYKLVALFITLVLWITFLGKREGVYTAKVALEYLTKDNMVIANEVVTDVEVRVAGPQVRLKKLRQDFKSVVTLDLSGYSVGQFPVSIPIESLQLPIGTKVVSISPERINVNLDQIKVVSLPVKIKWKDNKAPRRLEVSRIYPSFIVVKGASSSLGRIESVETRPIDRETLQLKDDVDTLEINAPLKSVEISGVLPYSDQSVLLELRRKKK